MSGFWENGFERNAAVWETEEFEYKGFKFTRIDTSMWACRDKNRWLINVFGIWKAVHRTKHDTIYTEYDSFEAACDAIANSKDVI